jgi:HEAT repeat protein
MNLERWDRELSDADAEVRRRAVLHAAQESSGEPLAALLMRALGDEDWRVRKEAAQVAVRLAAELPIVDRLVAALCQGENVGLRNAALDVLEELGERAAPALIAALPTAPEHARKFVIEALGEAGGPLVVFELKQAAWSEDVNLAGEAIEALARIGGPEAESVIRSRLDAKDPFLRLAALEALNRCEAHLDWNDLSPLIEDRMLRRVVIGALGRTGRVEAVDPLLHALEDPASQIAAAAAVSLARLLRDSPAIRERVLMRLRELTPSARAAIASLFGAHDAELRRAAGELLALAQDEQALGPIVTQLTIGAASPETLDALRDWGLAAVAPLLTITASQDIPEERAVALELAADLGRMREARDSEAQREEVRAAIARRLRAALHDHEPAVVAAAARSIGPFADAVDARPLVDCSLSTDGEVARAAAKALESLAGKARDAVQQALNEVEVESTQAAALASVLALLGGAEALDRLRGLLSSDDGHVRRAALHALGRIGGARAAELVALSLADEDNEVQVAAAQVLGRLRDEQGGVPGFSELLLAARSEHAEVRAAVARALGHTGLPLAVEPLCELSRDEDSGVAIAAVDALGQLASDSLGDLLKDALLHVDREVVKSALRALAGAADPSASSELVSALAHDAWDVRQVAAELLGELRATEAQPALAAQLARETDDLARMALLEALRSLAEEAH